MIECPHCKRENPKGTLLCIHCGEPIDLLMLLRRRRTRQLDESSLVEPVRHEETAPFDERKRLVLRVIGSSRIIDVDIHKTDRTVILGRQDMVTGFMPDIDLTPFDGFQLGVSRHHAALRINEDSQLTLSDLGSGNGTFLNGQQLTAHEPAILHNGDEVRLGFLRLQALIVDTNSWSRTTSS